MIKTIFKSPILAYRFFLSPWLGQSCRFTPTCSLYALEAIDTHGALEGSWLAFKRICRCHPWCEGGHDPVPPSRSKTSLPSSSCSLKQDRHE